MAGGAAVLRRERRVLAGVGAVTAATGVLQAAAPAFPLRLLDADDAPASRQLFGTVGMFMACTGGLLMARPADPAVTLMTAAQKLGASVAVGLAVRRGVFSAWATPVAVVDALSGVLALDAWRRGR